MKRQLAAVLAADICDYSRLMGEDAEAMLGALRRLRAEVFGPAVASNRGRIVKNMGDGWIVLFSAANDAVECAIQVQDRMVEGPKPGEPEVRIRVGVHLGDVTQVDNDVFGDGVNIAARLETETRPGSVAVSEAVFGSLDGVLRPAFDEAGAWSLKNIERPVQVWVRGEVAEAKRIMRSDRDGLNIAIVPVVVLDERADVSDLANAITGDVTAFLDATMWMAATTTNNTDGADYVLATNLRASGDRLRLESTILDRNGSLLRKDKFDGNLTDAFDWQDTVSEELSGATLQSIYEAELTRLAAKNETDMTSSDYVLKACLSFEQLDAASLNETLELASKALEIEPDRPDALYVATLAFSSAVSVGHETVWRKFVERHKGWLAAAEPIKIKYPLLNSPIFLFEPGDTQKRLEIRNSLNRVLRSGSLDFVTLAFCGYTFVFLGMPDAALDCLRRALRLGRHTPWRVVIFSALGHAHLQKGQFRKTLEYAGMAVTISPGYLAPYRQQAAAHAQLGQMDEARDAISDLLRLKPDDTITKIRNASSYADTPGTRRYFDGLKLAGLPE